uniref:Uncharacterized protein n=1 Tax=Steinernema glaseri TaxID=37863 RepID=A0A1I7YSV8_9BILA
MRATVEESANGGKMDGKCEKWTRPAPESALRTLRRALAMYSEAYGARWDNERRDDSDIHLPGRLSSGSPRTFVSSLCALITRCALCRHKAAATTDPPPIILSPPVTTPLADVWSEAE